MLESLYPVVSVVFGSVCFFLLGGFLAVVFQALRKTPIEPESRTVRWLTALAVIFGSLVSIKFVKPLYIGFMVSVAIWLVAWGFLSRIVGHIVRKKEIFTLSFWFTPKCRVLFVKDGV